MQLVVPFMGSPFKVYCIFICRIISITVFMIHIIICENIYNISFFSLPNKVAIEKASTSSEISPNLRSPLFYEKSGNNIKNFLVCSEPGELPEDDGMNEVALPLHTRFEIRALVV